jgi:alkanesulfonate monooxygenase SsuD/methylene tetrahydromethanopterin reductase-like flavin-dependent oxidoreductase (luciferase family)
MPRGSWDDLVVDWQRAESWGLDSAWLPDRLTNPWSAERPWAEGWTGLAALAAVTQRIECGVLVTAITGRNPALLALQALTADRISSGRVLVGLGAGGGPEGQALLGEGDWTPVERVGRFEEFVAVVSGHLHGRQLDESGQWYSSRGRLMAPPSAPMSPSIVVAANGRKTLGIAAKYGNGWNCYGDPGGSSLDLVRRANAQLDRHCQELGREPRSLRRSLLLGVAADTDWASATQFADLVRRFFEAGINDFFFYVPPSTSVVRRGSTGVEMARLDALVEEIASDIVPKLREELVG